MESALGSIVTPVLQEDAHGNLIIPLDNKGKPDYGLVMRHFRYLKGWSAQEVSELYSQALEDCGEKEETPVSARWILLMEQKNRVPVDEKRRWLLATLLNIPPVYFGLKAPEKLCEGIKLILPTIVEPVEVTEYWARLQRFWSSPYGSAIMDEVSGCIYNLQEALLYGNKQQKEQIIELLCNYLFLYANLCRYGGYYTSAVTYLNKVVTLAKDQENYALLAKVFYLRGYVFFDRWDVFQKREDRADLILALADFEAAQEAIKRGHAYNQYMSPPLLGAVLSGRGLAQAYNACDAQGRLDALSKIDRAGKIVYGSDFMRDVYFFRVDKEVYHVDKAEALLCVGWPKSVLSELTNVQREGPYVRLRHMYMDILEAEAYVARGQIEMGVAYAENVLMNARDAIPRKHFSRIVNMYETLKENKKYASSPDVARLGARLLRVRHPDLFREDN